MRFRRRNARLIGAVASVGLVTFGVVAAPQAAFANTACPNGQVCFYKDFNGQGQISIQKRLLSSPNSITNFKNSHYRDQTTLNDSVSSIINNTAGCLWVYKDADFNQDPFESGDRIIAHSGTEGGANFPNDAISSAYLVAC